MIKIRPTDRVMAMTRISHAGPGLRLPPAKDDGTFEAYDTRPGETGTVVPHPDSHERVVFVAWDATDAHPKFTAATHVDCIEPMRQDERAPDEES